MDAEPIFIKAFDKRFLMNGSALSVDFRIISEENYQELVNKSKRSVNNLFTDEEIWEALSNLDQVQKVEVMQRLFGKNFHDHIPEKG